MRKLKEECKNMENIQNACEIQRLQICNRFKVHKNVTNMSFPINYYSNNT